MTYSQIKELFKSYNAKYFNSELTCSIELSHTRRVKNRLGDFSPRRNKIRVFSNTHRNKTENDWKGTIIHEMVHAILAKRYGARNCGHNSRFHAILSDIFRKEFNIGYTRNRFHQKALATAGTTPAPTPEPTRIVKPTAPKVQVPTATLYKVLSTGKVGTFLKESTIYGKRHFTLKVEGMMFPFTVPADQTEAIAA